jgi:hypothetical protein
MHAKPPVFASAPLIYLTKAKAKQAVNDMVSLGCRCNVESHVKISEAIEKI